MTENVESFHAKWERLTEDEFMEFSKIENKRSDRPDLHAWLLLDELFPAHTDMVSAAEHDEIWLEPSSSKFETLTDSQIIELARCGVRHSDEFDSLCMFA